MGWGDGGAVVVCGGGAGEWDGADDVGESGEDGGSVRGGDGGAVRGPGGDGEDERGAGPLYTDTHCSNM